MIEPTVRKAELEDTNETCDGCNSTFVIGQHILTEIDSCCGGGCYRSICQNCVLWAAQEMEKQNDR